MRAEADAIATGALRYFLLKFTRNSVIAFDFKEALSFEGETGPYCQVRRGTSQSIFRKLDEEEVRTASDSDRVRSSFLPTDLIRERKDECSEGSRRETGNESGLC